MSVPTVARPTTEASCHWYYRDGTACYEVERSDGKGMRPTTLADARKKFLLPSVTTILQVLAKPQLTNWLIEQALLAALTSPRLAGEQDDAFVQRVIHTERVQDQESDIAKKRGTEIHDAIERYFKGEMLDKESWKWIEPVVRHLSEYGSFGHAEKILVSRDGFAGRTDLIQGTKTGVHIWDFKTTKKLPTKGSWTEHSLQLSAYAKAYDEELKEASIITTGNIYISTINQGEFAVFENAPWCDIYESGFKPLLTHWQWANNYHP